ncbi:tyrosine-type recombinase/integrase [Mesorhizobium sp. M0954]
MKLADAVARYVDHKQAMEMRFRTEAHTLRSFCRAMGDVAARDVSAVDVVSFLAGHGPITRFWEGKRSVLRGFYRFAVACGFTDQSRLPQRVPKPQQAFVPYIYSGDELRRLFDGIPAINHPRSHIAPETYRILLLVLYGAGLRGEALALTLADVDLGAGVLLIRESKFYKTRFVPIGGDLGRVLIPYVEMRRGDADAPLFLSRRGEAITRQSAEKAFCRLRAGPASCATTETHDINRVCTTMVLMSTPARNIWVAVLWRMVCGLIRFVANAANLVKSFAAWRSTMVWIPKRVIGWPWRFWNTGSVGDRLLMSLTIWRR